MAVQSRLNIDTTPFFLSGNMAVRDDELIKQDLGRTVDLAQYTLMSQEAATGKWVPFTDETATDGTAIPRGIYSGEDIPFAKIVDSDVPAFIVVGGGGIATFDKDKLIIENSKALDTVIDSGTVNAHTVEDDLRRIGLFTQYTVDATRYENS
jgi:hypothetical protein